MCNLSDGIEERGIAKGVIFSIINIMDNLKLSVEDAIAAVGVPESERDSYAATIIGLAK